MNLIILQNTLPKVFANKQIKSDIWLWEVSFIKGNTYLIEANSGCGKTSLCSYIYGNRNDYTGNILFDNTNIKNLNNTAWNDIRKQNISILFQDLKLFPELSAIENVNLKNSLTNHKTKEEILTLFDQLELTDRINQPIAKMSWGQQQRVALIRALCQPFDFLILDEPISHIDKYNANLMKQIIIDESKKQKAGIIATSIGSSIDLDYTQTLQL